MAGKFLIETETVDSAKEKINKIPTNLNSLDSEIKGYDTKDETTDETGIDLGTSFESAKNKLAEIITKGSKGATDTGKALENVVTKHTELQNSLKIEIPGTKGTDTPADAGGEDSTTPISSDDSGGDYGGGGGSGGGGGGDSLLESGGLQGQLNQLQNYQVINEKPTELTHAVVDKEKLSEESKKFFNRSDFKYDENTGYAKVGQRYVITCDPVFGNVGDCIDFVGANGVIVQCVIGALRKDESTDKRKISFVVNQEKWTEEKEEAFTKDLIQKTTEIRNYGNVDQQGTNQQGTGATQIYSQLGLRKQAYSSASAHQSSSEVNSAMRQT
ncbi:MAG: hypothetical protein IKE70_02145 [Bacilli bacterium]|nr:hypothetical protein [Bacilli bacterium]